MLKRPKKAVIPDSRAKEGCESSVRCVGEPLKCNVRSKVKYHSEEQSTKTMTQSVNLQWGVLTSPADEMSARAICETLSAPASDRARLFEQFVREIEGYMATRAELSVIKSQ